MERETFDVVVVGGGVTGCGAALDAATRGLSVALIEARDYAAGASSKSSKLIHGGLRYLEMLEFGLVREALRERRLLLTELAPHLVKPVPFLWPLTHRVWERPYLAAGLVLYDTMGGRRAVPRARHFTRAGALRIAPALNPAAFVGAVQFYDAQEDDARMVAVLARTAAAHGAALATNVRMDGLIVAGGRVTGVRARDLLEAGGAWPLRARHVVLATGAWTGGGAGAGPLRVRPSKGVHILVPRDRIAMDTGLLTRTEKSVLFVIPWGPHWLIGDTDTEWPYDPAHPTASRSDLEYLLAKVNAVLRDPLVPGDIEGVFAGLRPLVAAEGADTARLSRSHTVSSPQPGLSVIAGGKFTTYRVMARDVIDAAVADLGAPGPAGAAARAAAGPSLTRQTPLLGAAGYAERLALADQRAARSGLPAAQVERLLNRYGSCADDLLDLIASRPDLGQQLPGGAGYLAAEIAYACSHEGAVRLDDALARRTRITIETRDRGLTAAPAAAALMAAELGWDPARTRRELDQYQQSVAADLAAQAEPDEKRAYQARVAAADPADFYPTAVR
jgi:glycerol-3-phosphate dehydrogenase